MNKIPYYKEKHYKYFEKKTYGVAGRLFIRKISFFVGGILEPNPCDNRGTTVN